MRVIALTFLPLKFLAPTLSALLLTQVASAQNNLRFQCGLKSTCTQMRSCDEARYYLEQCGITRLDRDKDGSPCEALCGDGTLNQFLNVPSAEPPKLPPQQGQSFAAFDGLPVRTMGELSALRSRFRCGSKPRCGQMLSCHEAFFELLVCGELSRDGDDSGKPCEHLCGQESRRMTQAAQICRANGQYLNAISGSCYEYRPVQTDLFFGF